MTHGKVGKLMALLPGGTQQTIAQLVELSSGAEHAGPAPLATEQAAALQKIGDDAGGVPGDLLHALMASLHRHAPDVARGVAADLPRAAGELVELRAEHGGWGHAVVRWIEREMGERAVPAARDIAGDVIGAATLLLMRSLGARGAT